MKHIEALYPNAIHHTKKKVLEDLNRYLGAKEFIVSFEQYLLDRKIYLEQIWINVWLNRANNDVPRTEKKNYLHQKGFEVEGVDRKLINHLFRTEMRTYKPFDVIQWVTETYRDHPEKWKQQYDEARRDYIIYQEEEAIEEAKSKIITEIEAATYKIINENDLLIYLYVRKHIAQLLTQCFESKPRYKKLDPQALEIPLEEVGVFQAADYSTMSSFFEEFTGEIHKTRHRGRTFFEYETYDFVFERSIAQYIKKLVPNLILKELNKDLLASFKEIFEEELNSYDLEQFLRDDLFDMSIDFFEEIQEEYVTDLLSVADIPFDPVEHGKLFEQHLADRERKQAEELAAIERKKQEEAKMLDDIFGQEYRPSLGKNIHYVLHIGETNTGKTHHALKKMMEAPSGLYLAPLRLLALEVYDKLNGEGVACTLKTGEEEKVVTGASHFSCTVEMFHEKDYFDVVVIDEAQMIADKDRGFSWYKAITKANAKEVHIVGSRNLKGMVLQLLGDEHIEIHEYNRDIPLQVERKLFDFAQTKKGDALVCFSRRRVLETASRLQNSGFTVSMIYGSMPPETRKKEMQRFIKGETMVIVSTDAIGMGLNLPIRRIVFLENEKFDGTRRRRLSSQEVKQIAGRAGRKGIYDVGKVAFTKDIKIMKQLLKKEDDPVHTFAIAPTNSVFERFQRYSRDLGTFFELWEKFESPVGTEKASLSEERELYKLIRGTEIEARLSMMDLYGFLHLPFSTKDPGLVNQWVETMFAVVHGNELPDPIIKKKSLEDLELSYKAIGLHLLFLYRLDKRLEASYWEKVREELSDAVHESLKREVKKMKKKCRSCGRHLPWDHTFQICDRCHHEQYVRW
ncbi:helicase-related protein [Bacillus dakarensis]|uniref:helicase-related protein n=1 Tax=Robertmurraya dakarensis TaxID=1926278 RepID=UPI000980C787|nr:helicase-related protein [Bacillus dakarensis]